MTYFKTLECLASRESSGENTFRFIRYGLPLSILTVTGVFPGLPRRSTAVPLAT